MQSVISPNRLRVPNADDCVYNEILMDERPLSPCYQEPTAIGCGRRRSSGKIRSGRRSPAKVGSGQAERRRSSGQQRRSSLTSDGGKVNRALARNDTLNIMSLLKTDAELEALKNVGNTTPDRSSVKAYRIERMASIGNGLVGGRFRLLIAICACYRPVACLRLVSCFF